MCIRNSRATNPTRMPAPLASESSRILRDPAAGGRMVLGPRRRSRVRFQNLPELARPPSAETGLRRFLARRELRQLTRRRWPGLAARRARSTADGSRYLAVPAAPDARSRSWRSKSSGFGTAARCSMDMQPSMPGGTARTNRMTQVGRSAARRCPDCAEKRYDRRCHDSDRTSVTSTSGSLAM